MCGAEVTGFIVSREPIARRAMDPLLHRAGDGTLNDIGLTVVAGGYGRARARPVGQPCVAGGGVAAAGLGAHPACARARTCWSPASTRYTVVPIAEDKALSIGMLRYHRHLHFGMFADPAAVPAAARLPDPLAEEVRAFGDARPALTPS